MRLRAVVARSTSDERRSREMRRACDIALSAWLVLRVRGTMGEGANMEGHCECSMGESPAGDV